MTTLKKAAYIVVDDLESVKEEAGEMIYADQETDWSFEDVYGELADLDMNDNLVRTSDDEITFFKSVGTAYFDLIIGSGIYDKAIFMIKRLIYRLARIFEYDEKTSIRNSIY